jgi:hypothetical protein
VSRTPTPHGGARQYLLAAGLTVDEIERVRDRLREEPGTAR